MRRSKGKSGKIRVDFGTQWPDPGIGKIVSAQKLTNE
jgi:hypothetical protein